ncbi:MAG: hypothetical protein AAF993_20980, partial [Pseudomonadota bacterium]
ADSIPLPWRICDTMGLDPGNDTDYFQFTGAGNQAEQGFPLISDADGAEVAAGPLAHRLNRVSAEYVTNLAQAGFDVVLDFVALEPVFLVPYQSALAAVPVGFVGLFCDDEELDRRNQQRPDRAPGLALRQQRSVHFCRSAYDLELNSTAHDATDLAARVISHFAKHPPTPGM